MKKKFDIRWLEPHRTIIEAENKEEAQRLFEEGDFIEVNTGCDDPEDVTIEEMVCETKITKT